MNERNFPPQILLGANDPRFCTLLNLAIYLRLEAYHRMSPGAKYLLTEKENDGARKNLIAQYVVDC
jgi:hypothetical protein